MDITSNEALNSETAFEIGSVVPGIILGTLAGGILGILGAIRESGMLKLSAVIAAPVVFLVVTGLIHFFARKDNSNRQLKIRNFKAALLEFLKPAYGFWFCHYLFGVGTCAGIVIAITMLWTLIQRVSEIIRGTVPLNGDLVVAMLWGLGVFVLFASFSLVAGSIFWVGASDHIRDIRDAFRTKDEQPR